MRRRRLVSLVSVVILPLAGCTDDDSPTGTPQPSAQVTTSAGSDIEILVSQLAFDDDSTGPDAYYRLRNPGDTDATIKVETVLTIDDGGTYSSFAYVTVPAGEEVTLRYRIVRFDALSTAERRKVERAEGIDYRVFINGEERSDV